MNVEQKAQSILMSRAQLSDKVRRYKKVRWKKPVTMQPDTVWVKMIINIPVMTLRYVTASWCEFTPILVLNAHILRGVGFFAYLLQQPKHLLILPVILHNVNGEYD